MPLDHDGRDLLAALQVTFGPDFYAEVPDQIGADGAGRVEVTIDCACRVVDARVLGIDDLRAPARLAAAVTAAFADADGSRAIASAQRSARPGDLEREGAALLRGEIAPRLDPRAAREKQDVRLGGDIPARTEHVGRSANGYLAVRIGADGAPLALEVDDLWLTAVQPDRLRAALLEAFAQASHPAADLERI